MAVPSARVYERKQERHGKVPRNAAQPEGPASETNQQAKYSTPLEFRRHTPSKQAGARDHHNSVGTELVTALRGVVPRRESRPWAVRADEGIFAERGIALVELLGRHARFIGSEQELIYDPSAGRHGFLVALEPSVPEAFVLILIVKIIVDEHGI